MRIKDRNKWLPGGWQILFPQAGMEEPFSGSFTEVVNFTKGFYAKNPALVQKNGWSTSPQDIEDFVDEYNAQRMVAGRFMNFVDLQGQLPGQKKTSIGRLFGSAGNAAGNVKTALAIYRDLFGSEGKVVANEEAERRATVCVACPQNDTAGGIKKYFLKEAAAQLMGVFGMLKDMDVTTSQDDKLGVCQACECPMLAKVHVSNEILKKNLKSSQIAKLDPKCWIPSAIA